MMRRCLELASLGRGRVEPNPMVGAVVVYQGQIIGEGYHQQYGEAHAEVNAIASVKDKSLLLKSTIYVTLEPCAHHGKTPPCADLIVKSKIPRVVIGMRDPFSKVNGLGIQRLRQAGCEVKIGVLQEACEKLNASFITFHTQKRPYIILKWAETLDGYIDKDRSPGAKQQPNWITNEVCRSLVHKWRTEVQAILVGPNTALTDNPQLNVRSWTGKSPLRLVLDRYLRLPADLHLFDRSLPTVVFNTQKKEEYHNLSYIKLSEEFFIKDLLDYLYQENIQSLFVEGGRDIHQLFIENNLWDEARIFQGNVRFGAGLSAPNIVGNLLAESKLNDNYLRVLSNNALS